MPVKNIKRRTNDGLEGVITGLNENEKKIISDAGIGEKVLEIKLTDLVSEENAKKFVNILNLNNDDSFTVQTKAVSVAGYDTMKLTMLDEDGLNYNFTLKRNAHTIYEDAESSFFVLAFPAIADENLQKNLCLYIANDVTVFIAVSSQHINWVKGTDASSPVTINKGLTVAQDGNAVVGKNLEVDGTTKLNGGFEPIHTYEFTDKNDNPYIFSVFYEVYDENDNHYNYVGMLEQGNMTILCYGVYFTEGGKIAYLLANYYQDTDDFYSDTFTKVQDTSKLAIESTFFPRDVNFKTIFGGQSLVGSGNIDLYRHTLTLNDSIYWNFECNQALKCDSLQDLTTITKAIDGSEFVLDKDTLITYTGGVWKVGDTTITTVKDSVTTL